MIQQRITRLLFDIILNLPSSISVELKAIINSLSSKRVCTFVKCKLVNISIIYIAIKTNDLSFSDQYTSTLFSFVITAPKNDILGNNLRELHL